MKRCIKKLLPVALLLPAFIHAYDNAHVTHARFFVDEPRLEKPWLTTFDIAVGYGSTRHSRASKHAFEGSSCPETALLDLYGLHNMHQLGAGVPNLNHLEQPDETLIALALLPEGSTFGHLSFSGHFTTTTAMLSYYQNFTKGIFTQVCVPVRTMHLQEIARHDLTPEDLQNTPLWQAFLNQFETILSKNNLYLGGFKDTNVGDTTVLLGWTQNYEDTQHIDFFDTTLKFGILIPTGRKKNADRVFDVASGHDGHYAAVISGHVAIGNYDWLTFGGFVDGIFFAPATKTVRIKTASDQSGMIKLFKTEARVHKGALWNGGLYLKADHVICGFSLLLGYTYSHQARETISPCATCFDPAIACDDEQFKGFERHTFSTLIEYDFTRENRMFGPRIGLLINADVGGKRTLRTHMFGATFGLDIAFCF